MKVQEIREKFISFFEKKGHKVMPSSSLIPQNDPSVLLTTAGMQQFKLWFSNPEKAQAKRVATIQKCVRTNDIEEVGDNTHLTFFEMLGNFSFGDYFKKEAITWGLEFIEKELSVDRSRIWVSIFEGDNEVPRDDDSEKIWKSLGINDIRTFGRKDNFWGPTGEEGPCGPTTEIYVDDVEVWNLVFNEYYMKSDGLLLPLTQKGVDTGAGLERVAAIINGKTDIFETDELQIVIKEVGGFLPEAEVKIKRIITDHLRTAIFLLADGVRPSNLDRGYILRRLVRRAIRYAALKKNFVQFKCSKIAKKIIDVYGCNYPNLKTEQSTILAELDLEEQKFLNVLERGNRRLAELLKRGQVINGKEAFDLFQTYGFPLELSEEIARERGVRIDRDGFEAEFERHQEISRAGMSKKFSGGLENKRDPQIIRYHTAAHLLLAALREILGKHVHQKGSNITAERLRFDFSHPEKLTPEQILLVENWVNDKINRKLEVFVQETDPESAKEKGAEGEFWERYGKRVSVYSIGGDINSNQAISKEICGGPHVKNTGELGYFKIIKEESSSAGVRRIKAILE